MKKSFWAHKTAEIQKGAKVGRRTKIWHHCQIKKGAVVGEDCTIGHNCVIYPKASLGRGVKLESNIDVWGLVALADYVFVGPSAVFTNDKNPRAKYPKLKYPEYGKWFPTSVKEGATIGANATIICGNTVGKWAMVGAGAVVTQDVPDYALVVGVPAKLIGLVCQCGNKLEFKNGKAVCRVCQRQYARKKQKVSQIK